MNTFDQEIARKLMEAAESGELSQAKGYGKPPEPDAGWDSTPESLRMPMKILKDAGAVPPEVAMFHERARLRKLCDAEVDPVARLALQTRLNALEQGISLRLEILRESSNL
ncbi:MAG TPA: DUF1992 domain-containing protein [Casimicrobiaceae bacterium]|nr:DUF1992 domain-containing protein [Casimicrobiaceae bacterium]